MIVKCQVMRSGLFVCKDSNCLYRKECASHWSAESFREDGFTPEVVMEKDGSFNCLTRDQGIKFNSTYLSSYEPANVDTLGRGVLCARSIKSKKVFSDPDINI